ncbi:MAG: hypothetical protein H6Q33_2484 [Deltaproteobacteria bacterium]|jgi:hypothetical protein|nr:hypothetical protein [Deltaproteobacteria bacterium]
MATRVIGLRWSIASVLLAAIATAGCTTVPSREFTTYKDSFAKARAAGETVVLDYGVAVAQFEEIKAKQAAAKPAKKMREPFDPNAAGRNQAAVDHILIRMKAWEVVARYNDLLTALAEGKSAEELAGAVDGLSASLNSFPIKDVAAAATQVSGYLAPLRALALEAAKEHSRRQFIDAVGLGAPLINDSFLKLLRDETGDFYLVRERLNDREISALADTANSTGTRLSELVSAYQASRDADAAIAAFNADVERLPVLRGGVRLVFPLKSPSQRGTNPLTPDVAAQIATLAQDAKAQVAKVMAKDDELTAYRQVLIAYLGLLNQLEHSLRGLLAAAEQAQPGIPQGADLERAVILLRQAYMAYKDKGKD